jgi:hypothetical protein
VSGVAGWNLDNFDATASAEPASNSYGRASEHGHSIGGCPSDLISSSERSSHPWSGVR